MILKSIKVKNIRSIKNLDITLPQSTMLFYGDIGSGKSSILKAIEFALFGTLSAGDLKGDSLLRRGENKGFSELNFSIDGNIYTIHRELKTIIRKGETRVTQPEGWIIESDVKTSYSTTELRKKILSILNYSISRYENKGSIDIFRYTVYTPQEQIKEILWADPDERFEILKDVLEIEKYENTLNNLSNIKTALNKNINLTKQEIKSIGIPEEEIPKKESEIAINKEQIKKQKIAVQNKKGKLGQEKEKQKKI
ncbi:unnamed protein product, partial [marine sediment metagenome]